MNDLLNPTGVTELVVSNPGLDSDFLVVLLPIGKKIVSHILIIRVL